jgi:hypothetical protein
MHYMKVCLAYLMGNFTDVVSNYWSRDSSVCIAWDSIAGALFPAVVRDLSLFDSVQTGSGVHLASIKWVPGVL